MKKRGGILCEMVNIFHRITQLADLLRQPPFPSTSVQLTHQIVLHHIINAATNRFLRPTLCAEESPKPIQRREMTLSPILTRRCPIRITPHHCNQPLKIKLDHQNTDLHQANIITLSPTTIALICLNHPQHHCSILDRTTCLLQMIMRNRGVIICRILLLPHHPNQLIPSPPAGHSLKPSTPPLHLMVLPYRPFAMKSSGQLFHRQRLIP